MELPYNSQNRLLKQDDLSEILHRYGVTMAPKSINLYRQAFVHRSYCVRKNENIITGNGTAPADCFPLQEDSNERLEFLGDAVLNLVTGNYLFRRYPTENEGFLTRLRTKIVNGVALGALSGEIGFGKHMIISYQIEQNNGRKNQKLLEDVFEAFLGAMFCDFNGRAIKSDKLPGFGIGYQIVEQWLTNVFETHFDFNTMIMNNENGKERLIRYMQTHHGCHPRFVETQDGTDTTVVLYRNDEIVAVGKGDTKKAAEANAVQLALNYYGAAS